MHWKYNLSEAVTKCKEIEKISGLELQILDIQIKHLFSFKLNGLPTSQKLF